MEQISARDGGAGSWFHISTFGIDRSLFKTPDDFQQALNIIAVNAVKFGITVLAYCLMSNHIHIACRAVSELICSKFIDIVKQNYSRYYKQTYGEDHIFRHVGKTINLLKTEYDLRACIAYILRNPVEAKVCYNADQYPWSSYGCYFKGAEEQTSGHSGQQLGKKFQMNKLRTHVDLSATCVAISEDGYVVPESFVDVAFVENLFAGSRDELSKSITFNPYLALEYELANPKRFSLNHYELVKFASSLAVSKFGKKLSTLNLNERIDMVLSLYSDYKASPYQICQVLTLSKKTVYPILGLSL